MAQVLEEGCRLAVEVGDDQVDPAVPIQISGTHAHPRLIAAVGVRRDARHHAHLFEAEPAHVSKEEIRRPIVGDVQVDPPVVVDVGGDDSQPPPVVVDDPCFPGRVDEATAVIAKQSVREGYDEARGAADVPRCAGAPTELGVGRIPGPIMADVEVEVAVVIEVREGGRSRPGAGASQAPSFGDVLEGAVALVAVEGVSIPSGDEQVGVAVVVDVADGDPVPIAGRQGLESGEPRGVLEGAVALVAEEAVAPGGPAGVRRKGPTLDHVNVEPAVAIVVEEAGTPAGRLRELVNRGLAVVVDERQPGRPRVVGEREGRLAGLAGIGGRIRELRIILAGEHAGEGPARFDGRESSSPRAGEGGLDLGVGGILAGRKGEEGPGFETAAQGLGQSGHFPCVTHQAVVLQEVAVAVQDPIDLSLAASEFARLVVPTGPDGLLGQPLQGGRVPRFELDQTLQGAPLRILVASTVGVPGPQVGDAARRYGVGRDMGQCHAGLPERARRLGPAQARPPDGRVVRSPAEAQIKTTSRLGEISGADREIGLRQPNPVVIRSERFHSVQRGLDPVDGKREEIHRQVRAEYLERIAGICPIRPIHDLPVGFKDRGEFVVPPLFPEHLGQQAAGTDGLGPRDCEGAQEDVFRRGVPAPAHLELGEHQGGRDCVGRPLGHPGPGGAGLLEPARPLLADPEHVLDFTLPRPPRRQSGQPRTRGGVAPSRPLPFRQAQFAAKLPRLHRIDRTPSEGNCKDAPAEPAPHPLHHSLPRPESGEDRAANPIPLMRLAPKKVDWAALGLPP